MIYSPHMNREVLQNIFLVVFGIALILVGYAVFTQSTEISSFGEKLQSISQDARKAGDDVDKALTKITALEEDALRINETIMKMEEQTMMRESDDKPVVLADDVSVRGWPLDWELEKGKGNAWAITDSKTNKFAGTIDCPGTGIEGIVDPTTEQRMYSRSGQQLYATKLTGRAAQDTNTEVWVTAGSPSTEYSEDTGCLIRFVVSTPPTVEELGRIDNIYMGIE